MRRAYPYIRFSSPEQQKGDSLRRQPRECRQCCERNNGVLDESLEYLRELGKSAFRGANLEEEGGGLGLFLKAVEAGRIQQGSSLPIEKLDRFSRTDVDIAVSFFGRVLRAGITIVSIRSGQEYTLEMLRCQPTSILPAILELILANEESVKKSDRLTSAWAHKREEARTDKKPMTAACPLWLRLSEGQWEVIGDRAAVVGRIFEETINGLGGYRLAALLNTEGVPPMGRTKEWNQMSVYKILTNRAVLGEFQPQKKSDEKMVDDGDPAPGYFPRVIEDGLFYRAQTQILGRKDGAKAGGRAGSVFLFQKLTFDSLSGKSMQMKRQAVTKTWPHKYTPYLVPYTGAGQPKWQIRADVFEETMLKVLSELKPEDIFPPSAPSDMHRQAEDIKGKIAEITVRIEETAAAMANQPAKRMASVVAQIAGWEEEKESLVHQLEAVEVPVPGEAAFTEFSSVLDALRAAKPEEVERLRLRLRAVIRSLVKKITVVVREGKNRRQKRVSAAIEFNCSDECRLVFFHNPQTATVVLKGFTAQDLATFE